MSTALRAFLVVPISLILFAFVGAAFAQGNFDEADDMCPSVTATRVYREDKSPLAEFEEAGKKYFNLYGTICKDIEGKQVAANGICVEAHVCQAKFCGGKPCALPKLKVEDVRKALESGVPQTPITPAPPSPQGSLLDQWMFSPTSIPERKDTLSPSANSVGEILKQSDAQPGFIDKARESIGNFFFPQKSVNDLVELKGGTLPGGDSNPVRTTQEVGGAPGTNTFQPYGAQSDDQTNTFQQEVKDCDWWCRTKAGASNAWEGTKNVASKVGDGLDYVVNNVLTSSADGRKDSNINVTCADDPGLCPSPKTGIVTWYNCGTSGDSGPCIGTKDNKINPNDYTVASAYPDNTVLKVCTGDRCVAVVSNDKGGFIDNPEYSKGQRVGDLTRVAFLQIADPKLGLDQGVIKNVTLTPVGMYSDYASAKAAVENINNPPQAYSSPATYDMYGESTGNLDAAKQGFQNYNNEQADIAVGAINWNSFVTSDAQPEGAELDNLTPQQIAVREGLIADERGRQADEDARRAGLNPDAPPLVPEQPRTVAEIEAEVAKDKPADTPAAPVKVSALDDVVGKTVEKVDGWLESLREWANTPAPEVIAKDDKINPEVKSSDVPKDIVVAEKVPEVLPSLSDGPVAPQEGGNERVPVLTDTQVEQKVRSAFDQKIKDAQGTVRYAEELLARSESPAARESAQAWLDETKKRLNAVVETSISYSVGNPSPELEKVIERIRMGDEAGFFSQGLSALAEKAHSDAKAIGDTMQTSVDITKPGALLELPKMVWDMGAWGAASGVGLFADSGRNVLEKLDVVGFRADTDRELSAAIDPIGSEWKTAADVAVVAPFGVGLAKSAIRAGVDAGIEAGASVTRSFFGDVAQSDARVVVRDSAGFATSLERGAVAVEDLGIARSAPADTAGASLPKAANIDSAGGGIAPASRNIDEALAKFNGAADDVKSLGSAEPAARTAPAAPTAPKNPFLDGTDSITSRAAGKAEVSAPAPSNAAKNAIAEIDRIAAESRAAAEAPILEIKPPLEVPAPSGVPNIGDYVPTYADKIRLAWNDTVTGAKNTASDLREYLFGGKAAEAPVIPEGGYPPRVIVDNTGARARPVEPPPRIAEEIPERIAVGENSSPVPLEETVAGRRAAMRDVNADRPAPPEPTAKPVEPEAVPPNNKIDGSNFKKIDIPGDSPVLTAERISAKDLTPQDIARLNVEKAPDGYTYMYRGIDRTYAIPKTDQQFSSDFRGVLENFANKPEAELIRIAVPKDTANPFSSPYAIDRIGNYKTSDVLQYPREWFTKEIPYYETPEFQAKIDAVLAKPKAADVTPAQGDLVATRAEPPGAASPDIVVTRTEPLPSELADPVKAPSRIEPAGSDAPSPVSAADRPAVPVPEQPSFWERWFGKSEPAKPVETVKAPTQSELDALTAGDQGPVVEPRVKNGLPDTATRNPVDVIGDEGLVVERTARTPSAVPDAAGTAAGAAEKPWYQRWYENVFGKKEPVAPAERPGLPDTVTRDPIAVIDDEARVPVTRERTSPPDSASRDPLVVMGDEGPVVEATSRSVPSPAKAWDDPALTRNEFISGYKARYPDTTLSDAQLAERFNAGQRLNPETGRLKVPDAPAAETPVAPSESLFKPWSEWSTGGKWVAGGTVGGTVALGGSWLAVSILKDGSDGPPPAVPPPPPSGDGDPSAGAVVPGKKEKKDDKDEVPPPPVRRGQACGPNDTEASNGCYPPYNGQRTPTPPSVGDDYCIVSIDPVIVWPGAAARNSSVPCYNKPTVQNPAWRSFPSLPPAPLASPSPAQQPKPTTPPVTPPATTPTPPKPFATLIADPATILSGKKSQLIWSSVNTSSCELFAPGNVAMATGIRGSTSTLALATTTQFSLNCSAASGATTSAQTTVTVH